MKKYFAQVLSTIVVLTGFLFIVPVMAVDLSAQITGQLDTSASGAQVGAAVDPRIAAAALIQFFLTIVGSLFFVLIIMSGYWLVTARGDDSKVEKAQAIIRGAIIGLAIVLLSYGITLFVSKNILRANQAPVVDKNASGPELRLRDF